MAENASTTRRTFLKGAVIAAATPAVAVAPSFQRKPEHTPSTARLETSDDHALPFAQKGDVVVFDENDRSLENGAIYVTRAQRSGNPFIGRALLDTEDRWWLERFGRGDVYGPIGRKMFEAALQGRVMGVWKPNLKI